MKASELRALPVNELEAKMKDLKEEYLRLRYSGSEYGSLQRQRPPESKD